MNEQHIKLVRLLAEVLKKEYYLSLNEMIDRVIANDIQLTPSEALSAMQRVEKEKDEFMNSTTDMYQSELNELKDQLATLRSENERLRGMMKKAFEDGAEVYYDDNGGRSSPSQSLLDEKFNYFKQLNGLTPEQG
jgi:hypothetical protein